MQCDLYLSEKSVHVKGQSWEACPLKTYTQHLEVMEVMEVIEIIEIMEVMEVMESWKTAHYSPTPSKWS